MNTEKIAKSLTDILPDRVPSEMHDGVSSAELIGEEARSIKAKAEAKELARIKYREKQRLKTMEAADQERKRLAKELGLSELPGGSTPHQVQALAAQQKKVETIEAIEAETVEPLDVREVAAKSGASSARLQQALALQGASRPELTKLLTSLNINLSVQLTKNDTANLLACLLTCNEMQLQALYNNKKIPITIKTVIKRLQEDAKLGNIETIEKLWDRIFGKGQMQIDLPEAAKLEAGILPNVPISREAYILIRDRLIK